MEDEVKKRMQLRSLEEAHDEVDRELQVRDRIYDKWVKEGRMSKTEARDRMERMHAACQYLKSLQKIPVEILQQHLDSSADAVPF